MNIELITAKKISVSPQMVADDLNRLVCFLSKTEMNDNRAIFVYNILYAACALLKRYETASRESIFIASVDENNDSMRENIKKLHKNALHTDIEFPLIMYEDMEL